MEATDTHQTTVLPNSGVTTSPTSGARARQARKPRPRTIFIALGALALAVAVGIPVANGIASSSRWSAEVAAYETAVTEAVELERSSRADAEADFERLNSATVTLVDEADILIAEVAGSKNPAYGELLGKRTAANTFSRFPATYTAHDNVVERITRNADGSGESRAAQTFIVTDGMHPSVEQFETAMAELRTAIDDVRAAQ